MKRAKALLQAANMYKFLLLCLITIFLVIGIPQISAGNTDKINTELEEIQKLSSQGYYQQAKTKLQELKNILNKQPDSIQKATVFRRLGNILRITGNLGKINLDNHNTEQCEITINGQNLSEMNSIDILNQSLEMSEKLKDDNGIIWGAFYLANSFRTIAEKNQSVNDIELANFALQKSLICYKQALSQQINDDIKIRIELNQMNFLSKTKKWLIESGQQNDYINKYIDKTMQNFLDKWRKFDNIITNLPQDDLKIYAKINLVQNLIKINEIPILKQDTSLKINEIPEQDTPLKNIPNWLEISKILSDILPQIPKLNNDRMTSYVLGYLAKIDEKNHKYDEAIDLTNQAIGALINLKENADIEYQWLWQLGRLYRQKGEVKEAIAKYYSSIKNIESLGNNLVGIDPDIQYSFQDEIEPVYRELIELLLDNKPSEIVLKEIFNLNENYLKIAITVMEKLKIAELNNYFYDNCFTVKSNNINKINLENTAIIHPIVLANTLDVILSLPGQDLETYRNPLPENFEMLIKELPEKLALAYNENSIEYQDYAQTLYSLIMPSEMYQKLKDNGIKTLIFVLDTKLQNIPMATLFDGKKYLIEDFAMTVIPSLKLFENKPISPKSNTSLIGGLYELNPNNSYSELFKNDLPYVETELKQVNKYIPNNQKLLNEQFTRKNIESELGKNNFSLVHFATHAKFSSDREKTLILTWDDGLNITQLRELMRGKKIELLVLSACETAKGDKRASLGLAGVAVGSGARSTLATLWTVNDEFASEFMGKFYEQLITQKKSKSEAIKNTITYFLTHETYKYPSYWGAFILIGNWL